MRGFANEGLCMRDAAPGLIEKSKKKKMEFPPWKDRRGKKREGNVGGRRTDGIQKARRILVTRSY